jgi:hypothetical protein
MNRFRFTLSVLALAVFTLAASPSARAQTRTWVSGTGNDADPCSFTAPCKTFSGALSKTSRNGEISVKDSGAYSAVTINKSITIDGHDNFASILATGTTGIIINLTDPADTKKTVRLRNLSLNGTAGVAAAGPGFVGIRILAADKVYIEDCLIEGFEGAGNAPNGRGISDERSTPGKLFVTNTTVRNSRTNAIVVFPSGGSPQAINAVLDNVRVYGNGGTGIYAGPGTKVTIMNSNITGNGNAGIQADSTTGTTEVNTERTVVAGNSYGIYSGPGAAIVRMSETLVTRNNDGLHFAGGTIHTYGNCRIAGNTTGNGPPTSNLGGEQ